MPKKLEPSELLEAEKDGYRLFGFTASEFTERITGAMIDKWATLYDSHIAPSLVDETAPPTNVKKFSSAVLESLFQRGRFHMIFNEWKEYIASTIFRVPSNVTLPEDEVYHDAAEYNDQKELDAEQAALEEHIIQLRAQIAMVEAERKNTQLAIQAVREYKKDKAAMEEEEEQEN